MGCAAGVRHDRYRRSNHGRLGSRSCRRVSGGDVDRSIEPTAYDILSTRPVPFRFHDDSDDIRYAAPIIGLGADDD